MKDIWAKIRANKRKVESKTLPYHEYMINFPGIKVSYSFLGWFLGCAVIALMIIPPIYRLVGTTFWGNEIIGSTFEKSEYKTQYWVYLQSDNNPAAPFTTSSTDSDYRVKGDIEHNTSEDDSYLLDKVYWHDSSTSSFDYCNITLSALYREDTIAGETKCTTSDNKTSYIIRLGEKVDPNELATRKTMDELLK